MRLSIIRSIVEMIVMRDDCGGDHNVISDLDFAGFQ